MAVQLADEEKLMMDVVRELAREKVALNISLGLPAHQPLGPRLDRRLAGLVARLLQEWDESGAAGTLDLLDLLLALARAREVDAAADGHRRATSAARDRS